MSLIPGIESQQTTLIDGAQIPSGKTFNANAVTETTAGNGVQIQGRTNGTPIEAGKVGQAFGTERASTTVGSSYSTSNATALTASSAPIVSLTLNKGIYLVNAAFGGYHDDTVLRNIIWTLAVNGVSVQAYNATVGLAPLTAWYFNTGTIPIVIKTDSQAVALYALVSSLGVGKVWTPFDGNELWAIRIG